MQVVIKEAWKAKKDDDGRTMRDDDDKIIKVRDGHVLTATIIDADGNKKTVRMDSVVREFDGAADKMFGLFTQDDEIALATKERATIIDSAMIEYAKEFSGLKRSRTRTGGSAARKQEKVVATKNLALQA